MPTKCPACRFRSVQTKQIRNPEENDRIVAVIRQCVKCDHIVTQIDYEKKAGND